MWWAGTRDALRSAETWAGPGYQERFPRESLRKVDICPPGPPCSVTGAQVFLEVQQRGHGVNVSIKRGVEGSETDF